MSVPRHKFSSSWPIKLAAFAVLGAGAVLLAMQFDQFLFDHVYNRHGVESWLYVAMRQLGEMETWVVIALLVMIVETLRRSRRTLLGTLERSLIVIWSPMLAGLASTLLKLLVRRERPDVNAGEYVFRPWDVMTWDSSNLGLPSGHASVAFGGACMLALMYPRLAPVWLLGATLCGLSRLMTQAHFFSDVVAGAVLGVACAWLVWPMYKTWFEDRDPVLMRARRALRSRRPTQTAS